MTELFGEPAAFEAAIRAAPEDEAPRLVYADWVQEHGDAAYAEALRSKDIKVAIGTWSKKGGPLRDILIVVCAVCNLLYQLNAFKKGTSLYDKLVKATQDHFYPPEEEPR